MDGPRTGPPKCVRGLCRQVAIKRLERTHAGFAVCHCWQFHGRARSCVNQFPGVALIINRSCTGACCAGTSGAIVLTGHSNAIAFFFGLSTCWCCMGGHCCGDDACNCECFHCDRHLINPFGLMFRCHVATPKPYPNPTCFVNSRACVSRPCQTMLL
jgi:hypothetical protein